MTALPGRPADEVAGVALPRLCGGFAAVHAAHAVLAMLLSDLAYRPALIVFDGGCALGFALLAMLASTRRLPGWRRETVAALVPIAAAGAATARCGLIDAAWPAAELVLATAAACLVTARHWFWAVIGTCGLLWAGCLATAVVHGGFGMAELAVWTHVGLLVGVAGLAAASVRTARTATGEALVEANRRLIEQSVRDPLTGLANRRGLELVAHPMIDLARRQGQAMHCLVLDLESVRGISVEHGVADGERLLLAVSEAVRQATRSTDVVARWGADGFAVLGPGTGMSPLEIERRVRACLSADEGLARELWQGRVTAGVATLVPWDADNLAGLLHRAELDLGLRRTLKRRAASRMSRDDGAADLAVPGATTAD